MGNILRCCLGNRSCIYVLINLHILITFIVGYMNDTALLF